MPELLEVEAAQRRVLDSLTEHARRTMHVDAVHAAGSVLACPVVSDIDVPPYRKALMDGYAVRAEDAVAGTKLVVVEQITAGQTPTLAIARGEAVRIMTGAPLPEGADAVVRVEDTAAGPADDTVVLKSPARAGDNLMEQGFCVRCGETVLEPGHQLRPHEVGFLCEIGAARVAVYAAPRLAILATGDELVPPTEKPGPGQIRNSNTSLLAALAQRDGAEVSVLGIAPDQPEELAALMTRGLECDVLLLSGGVSVGIRDLVPDTLASLGVECQFHGVRLKPGKPVWFGVRRLAAHATCVFGLPGNPMSSFVGYELFVRPAIERLRGLGDVDRREEREVVNEFAFRSGRRTFHPGKLVGSHGVEILSWKGSVDQRVMTEADALVDLEAGKRVIEQGTRVWVQRI